MCIITASTLSSLSVLITSESAVNVFPLRSALPFTSNTFSRFSLSVFSIITKPFPLLRAGPGAYARRCLIPTVCLPSSPGGADCPFFFECGKGRACSSFRPYTDCGRMHQKSTEPPAMRITCCRQDDTHRRILNPFYSKGGRCRCVKRAKRLNLSAQTIKQNNHGGSDTWATS